jgi:hypothetical protein
VVEDDIFTNQKDVVKNLKDSAANLGIDPNKVVPPEKKKKQILVAKKNCKVCYGQGVLTIAGHDVATNTKEKNNGSLIESNVSSDEGTVALQKPVGKFKKTQGRNSCKKEPAETIKALMYCKCVRPILVDADLQTV